MTAREKAMGGTSRRRTEAAQEKYSQSEPKWQPSGPVDRHPTSPPQQAFSPQDMNIQPASPKPSILPKAPPGQDPTGPHYGYGDLPRGGPGPEDKLDQILDDLGLTDKDSKWITKKKEEDKLDQILDDLGLTDKDSKWITKKKEGISDVQDLFPIIGEETIGLPGIIKEKVIDPIIKSDFVKDAGKMFGPFFSQALKGTQSTARFFENLKNKGAAGLSKEDKVILANLMAADKEGANVFGETVLDEWMEKFKVSDKKGFLSSLDKAKEDLNEEYQTWLSDIDEYETGRPTGVGGIFGLGEGRTDGITLEALKDRLGVEGLAFLKANDPAKYYSFMQPTTTGSMEDLANLQVTKGMQGTSPDLVRKIFEARAEQDRMQHAKDLAGGGGGGGGGIPSLYAGPITPSDPNAIITQPESTYPEGYGSFLLNPPPPVPPGTPTVLGFPDSDGDGIDDRWQAGPGQPFHGVEPVEGPLTAAATAATAPTPFDYSQWPQFGPQYPGHYANWGAPSYAANGGIVCQARPQYNYWNQIANAYPGMS